MSEQIDECLEEVEAAQAGGNSAAGPDSCITYHGTVSTLDLFTDAARQWVEGNVESEPWQ